MNALIIDQKTKLKDFMDVSVLRAVDFGESMLNTNVKNSNPNKLIFAHPEALLEDKKVFQFWLKSKTYKNNLRAIVVDDAHLVTEWLVYLALIVNILRI